MIKRISILFTMLLMFSVIAFSQPIPKGIILGFESGDAKKVAEYFHANLEIKLVDNLHVISKNQATRLLQDFFNSHSPQSFKITYEGEKKESKYAIGELLTSKGLYRVNIYFIDSEKDHLIYNLTIEKI